MAVPTITSLTPAFGPTGGVNQIEIIGTNFNVPSIPPASGGPAGAFVNTVDVKFGGVSSENVMVITATRLIVHPPPTPIVGTAATGYGEGDVDVEVLNLDAVTGLPIGGETVTATDGYNYRRPQLASATGLLRLVTEVIVQLRKQIIPNVSISTHTDYDPETGDMLNITGLAEFPGIAITGPDLVQNRFFSNNEQDSFEGDNPGEFQTTREPYTADVGFSLVGVSDSKIQLINMMHITQVFFRRNKFISLLRDPNDLSKGSVKYEIDITDGADMKTIGTPNSSNVRAFGGGFEIRGFDIEGLIDFTGDFAVDASALVGAAGVTLLTIEQMGSSFGVGPSPGTGSC